MKQNQLGKNLRLVTAIMGVLLLMANQIVGIVLGNQTQGNVDFAASQIERNIAQLLNAPASWKNTYGYSAAAQNAKLSCLVSGAPCTTTGLDTATLTTNIGGPLSAPVPVTIDYILNSGPTAPANIVYSPGAGPGSGFFFNQKGGPCAAGHTFHAPPAVGDDYCPLQFLVKWEAVCTSKTCENPQSYLWITGTYNGSANSRVVFNTARYSMGPFAQGSSATAAGCSWVYDAVSGNMTETCATNVGVGVAAPQYLLSLYSPTNASQIQVSNAALHTGYITAGTVEDTTWISGGTYFNGANWIATDPSATIAGASPDGFEVFTSSAVVPTSVEPWGAIPNFIISTTNGHVGIGTASPGDTLDVVGIPGDQNVLRVSNASTDTGIELWNTTAAGHNWRILSSGTGSGDVPGSFGIQDESAIPVPNTRLYIDGTGLTTIPTNLHTGGVTKFNGPTVVGGALSVTGGATTITGTLTGYGILTANTSITSSAFNYNSDASLKTDIHEIEDPLADILNLHGVRFKWKSSQQDDIGFIAQDVEKVVPDLVRNVTGQDGQPAKAVKYGNIAAIIVESIKKLWTMLMDHESRIQQLEVAHLQDQGTSLQQEHQVIENDFQSLEHRIKKLEARSAE